MTGTRRPWQEELTIIDRVMRAISDISDPETLVNTYWEGISEILPFHGYLSVSRRGVQPPEYLITRSSRFTEHYNPWTQRDQLPRLTGGLLGEIAYANRPFVIEDLPDRLKRDDPAFFYLDGFQTMIALPQYDRTEGLNVSCSLLPREVTIDHSFIPMLHWQAGLFGRGTTNLVLRNQLSSALSALDREMQAVGDIQRSLLPAGLPQVPGFELAAFYETSSRAGGDYYDFFPLDGGGWGVFIADVSGHGTPAAVLMAVTHAIAHAKPGTHTPPPSLLSYLNDHLIRSYTRNGTFVTAFYAVLDPAVGTLTYARAGHNPPRLVSRARGEVVSLDGIGALPLGIVDDQTFGQATVQLEPGDMLLLYTDGITETMAPVPTGAGPGARREMFGVERLDRLLLDCGPSASAQGCIDRIRQEVAAFRGAQSASDDETLVAMRCLQP